MSSGIERRKYPRAILPIEDGVMPQVVGAVCSFDRHEGLAVLDLSHSGAAFRITDRSIQLSQGELIRLRFRFGQHKEVPMAAKVVRATTSTCAVHFLDVDAQARLALQNFLGDKVIGLNIWEIPKHLHGAGAQFDYWLHGPADTNLYMWVSDERLQEAAFELNSYLLIFDHGTLYLSESQALQDQYDDGYVKYTEAEKHIAMSAPFLHRVLDVLTQIQVRKEVVRQLIDFIERELT